MSDASSAGNGPAKTDDGARREGSVSSERLGVRELPAQQPRVESGPTRFGDDWCGVFLRGDAAYYYAMALRNVLHPNGEDVDAMTGALARIQLRGLLRILEASDERTHTPNAELTGAPLGAPGARRPVARPVE